MKASKVEGVLQRTIVGVVIAFSIICAPNSQLGSLQSGGPDIPATSNDAALLPSVLCVPEDNLIVAASCADGSAVFKPAHSLCQVLVSGVGGQKTSCMDVPDVGLKRMRTCSD